MPLLFEVFQFYARSSLPLKKVRLEKSGSLYLGTQAVRVLAPAPEMWVPATHAS